MKQNVQLTMLNIWLNHYIATLKKIVKIAQDKGASTWLTTLPIAEHGFDLHKGAFQDALCLGYVMGGNHHYCHH